MDRNDQSTFSESLNNAIYQLIAKSEAVPKVITLKIDVINEAGAVLGRLTFSPTKTEKVWQC
ncbi:MAG: hypothetical protein PHY54_00745 [Methylococcales bacterium]|nr:hypothetical protein [Methylococcales bacterium]